MGNLKILFDANNFNVFAYEGDGAISPAHSDVQRRAEQLVLYIRALQLLSSALNLSKEELQAERLHPSPSVKQVKRKNTL